jgi:tetratricopeptide (TPR) repeat protein
MMLQLSWKRCCAVVASVTAIVLAGSAPASAQGACGHASADALLARIKAEIAAIPNNPLKGEAKAATRNRYIYALIQLSHALEKTKAKEAAEQLRLNAAEHILGATSPDAKPTDIFTLNSVGDALHKSGLTEAAKRIFGRARDIARALPNVGDFARTYHLNIVAEAVAKVNLKSMADQLFKEALAAAETVETGNQFEPREKVRVAAMRAVAMAMHRGGMHKRARQTLQRAQDQSWKIQVSAAISLDHRLSELVSIVESWIEVGDVERALALSREIFDPGARAKALVHVVGDISKRKDTKQDAKIIADEILRIIPFAARIETSPELTISTVVEKLAKAGWSKAALHSFKLEKATRARNKVISFDRYGGDSSLALAKMLVKQGRYDQAQRLYDTIPAAHSGRQKMAAAIAVGFYARKAFKKARQWRSRALKGGDGSEFDIRLSSLIYEEIRRGNFETAQALIDETPIVGTRRSTHLALLSKMANESSIPLSNDLLCKYASAPSGQFITNLIIVYTAIKKS